MTTTTTIPVTKLKILNGLIEFGGKIIILRGIDSSFFLIVVFSVGKGERLLCSIDEKRCRMEMTMAYESLNR
jgi:hypothetical protein